MKLSYVCLFMALSCTFTKKEDPEAVKAELMKIDRDFSAMSEQKGMKEAFMFYSAAEIIKPQPNQQPLVGLEAVKKSFDARPANNVILTWDPLKADVSGDIGYTFGHWVSKSNSSGGPTLYGNYVSIWKRQADGSWKVVFDTGNPTPGPTKL